MAKVASAGPLPPSNAPNFGFDGAGISKISTDASKRKTPSELRGELIKRKKPVELTDEFQAPLTSSMRNATGAASGLNKPESSKAPRFSRMDEHYPITKTSRLLFKKENPKENVSGTCPGGLKNPSPLMDLNGTSPAQSLCPDETVAADATNAFSSQADNAGYKLNNNTFKSVAELSLRGDKSHSFSPVDMGRALKGLVTCEPYAASTSRSDSINGTESTMIQQFDPEIHINSPRIPLDLTLKETMRFLCSSSVNWFHRLINCASHAISPFTNVGFPGNNMTCSSEPTSTSHESDHVMLNSWVHPQSSLPHAAISALASVPGGQTNFLNKRQEAWEDSFRSLYYMLRKGNCEIFYVCTTQFVVMFAAPNSAKETKRSCRAYVSQSTRNLRALLKERDVSFLMPLCRSKVEETTTEDLVELSEIEKHLLGQTREATETTPVDNTPQSLLVISGNKNVNALYDFLLNYRFFISSLTGADVPMLYSPIPFENAALSRPEVRCKQVRRINSMSEKHNEPDMQSELVGDSSSGICYSVEIRDSYLPPWVVSSICNAMCSKESDFQVSFVTESTTIGLNVGLDSARGVSALQASNSKSSPVITSCFGIPNTTLSLQQHSGAYLKGLKYSKDSYTAFLSPVV